MTLRTASIKETFATDAEFQTIVQWWHNNFTAMGLVQTADTGQINVNTVTKPTVVDAIAGYQVWRFADTLQATVPIFFKIEYGTNSSSAITPQFFITVGSGSNGAGAITAAALPVGTTTVRRAMFYGLGGGASSFASYFDYSADGSGFVALYAPASGNTGGGLFAIERFRNADGSSHADGFNVFYAQYNSCFTDFRYFVTGGAQPTVAVGGWAGPAVASGSGSLVFGTTLYPLPIFTGGGSRPAGPSQLLLAIGRLDLTVGTIFSLPHYGASRSWIAAGAGLSTSGFGQVIPAQPSPITSFAIRGD